MHSNYQYTNAVKQEPVATLATDYKPKNIKELTKEKNLSEFKLSEASNKALDVVVSWEKSDDLICQYYVFWFDKDHDQSGNIDPELINNVSEFNSFFELNH